MRGIGLGALAGALVVVGPAAPAEGAHRPRPAALTETRIASQVKPGTVLIVHDEVAEISMATGTFDHDLFRSLLAADAEIVGLRRSDAAAGLSKGVQRYLLPDPARFIKVASRRTVEAEAVFTGSGAVVSGNGYVVTNAHVVAPDEEEVLDALIEDSYGEMEDDLYELIDEVDTTLFGGSIPLDAEEALEEGYLEFMDENSEIGEPKRSTAILSDQASPAERRSKGKPADIVEVGSGYPDKDVAILKMQGSNHYTVPLGDDTDTVSGNRVFAIGYPGDATFDSGAATGTQLEASISSGTVSARRKVEGGYSVIQHNAAIQHGSSGGPMVDETGRIVGLTTAGSDIDEQGTFYFSVPVTLVKEFLLRKNVGTGSSPVTDQYIAALDQFDQKHYRAALKQLQRIDRTSPGRPFVAAKIAETQRRLDAGDDVSDRRIPVVPLAIAAGVLVLLLLALGLGLGLGLRSSATRRPPTAGPTPRQGDGGPPPGPPPPWSQPGPPPPGPGSWPPPAPWPPPPSGPPRPPPSGGFAPPSEPPQDP